MQTVSENWNADITALDRSVIGKVELYNGSTLASTFLKTDALSSINIEKTAVNGSFFGYSICQKATVSLVGVDDAVSIEKGNVLKIYLGTATEEGEAKEFVNAPDFIVTEVQRDEINKTLTVTAYDSINDASSHTASELQIEYPITIGGVADAIASAMGLSVTWEIGEGNTLADTQYTEDMQLNLGGTETLRDMLGYIAQATGTVCFVKNDNTLCFKQLANNPVFNLDKAVYFSMTVGKAINLTQVTSSTELGDNITAGTEGGKSQVFYSNPFITSHTGNADMLELLLSMYSQIVMRPYNIRWRGNPALEFGDCVRITMNDNTTADIFYLGETITYNGGMVATCSWEEEDGAESVDGNPTTIGDALKQTYAKVDKVNAQVDLVAKQADGNTEAIGAIQVNADSISASVESIKKDTEDALGNVNESIETLTNSVNAQITSEQVQIQIQTAIGEGVNKVTTSTGYTLDEEGLTVSKSDSPMSTTISDNGMTVSYEDETRLTANSEGVIARNLHAETYLTIGLNSRFEDYANNTRTGCFWIGTTIEEEATANE